MVNLGGMKMERTIQAPFTKETAESLKDYVYIDGIIYTARDAAHKRMIETLDEGKELPVEIKDTVIYYMGPSPAREGRVIGSAGPTTSSRMDKYTPRLLDLGMGAMIGKGKRSKEVTEAIVRNKAVYFAAGRELFCQNASRNPGSFLMTIWGQKQSGNLG